jgi:hypothetical protein
MRRFAARWIPVVALPVVVGIAAFGWGARRAPARAASVSAAASSGHPRLSPDKDPRLEGAYRFAENGWIYVHLQGTPEEVGFQHGYLLAPEIDDSFNAVRLEDVHSTHHDWAFFRTASHDMLWPQIYPEYQAELKGIVEGLHARGVKMDLDDLVALNAFEELPGYYVPWYDAQHKQQEAAAGFKPASPDPISLEHCSAFVATGSYTKKHGIVIAHNNWTTYVDGERWRIMFDIAPQHGYRILMDGFPGVITSDDDFAINSAGIMVTETTISDFHGWDPNGIPEFARSREAIQYATSIPNYVKLIDKGNNGGYANDWLLGDEKTGEIGRFEEGLKHTRLWTSKDGYFVGSNFPSDPEVTKDETTFNVNDMSNSANARHVRWDELMKQYKGKIDVKLAEKFEGDHYDSYEKKIDPDEHTLCGHIDDSPRGNHPNEPFGAVQSKVTDSEMAGHMTLIAHLGHPCGQSFYVKPFLKAHPEYDWEKSILRDMPAYPWTTFLAGEQGDTK